MVFTQSIEERARTRHIALRNSHNIRDVGGYPTKDGGRIRRRAVLRGDSPHRLEADEQELLLEYGLRAVIDLRGEAEVEERPSVFEEPSQIQYWNIPLYDEALRGRMDDLSPTLHQVYELLLDHAQERFRRVLALSADPENQALLVNCAFGKDRTGLVIALLLGLAGVPDEIIVEDYALTEKFIRPLIHESLEYAAEQGKDLEEYEVNLHAIPDAMEHALDHIHARYDGYRGYGRAIGLSDGEINRIRSALLE
jgi:protein-tyrosine phosphatase